MGVESERLGTTSLTTRETILTEAGEAAAGAGGHGALRWCGAPASAVQRGQAGPADRLKAEVIREVERLPRPARVEQQCPAALPELEPGVDLAASSVPVLALQ